MNKIDPFAVFLHFIFIFIYFLLFIVMAVKVWLSFIIGTDVPMYSRPTWGTSETITSTTVSTTVSTTATEEVETTMTVMEFDAEYYED